jgi:hypothetical protein
MLMFGGGVYRVAPEHNSETNKFFGSMAKSKISEERHDTNDDFVQGHKQY